jgi:hypothetical protein
VGDFMIRIIYKDTTVWNLSSNNIKDNSYYLSSNLE